MLCNQPIHLFYSFNFNLLLFLGVNENHVLVFFIITWNFMVGLFMTHPTLYLFTTGMGITGGIPYGLLVPLSGTSQYIVYPRYSSF